MQVLENIFRKGSILFSENYAHSLHGSLVITWDAFPAAFCSSLLEQGCDSHNFLLLTLQSCVTLPMRETQPCCLSELQSSSILPWYGARCESKANHRPLRTTHIRPFVARPVTKTAIPPPSRASIPITPSGGKVTHFHAIGRRNGHNQIIACRGYVNERR